MSSWQPLQSTRVRHGAILIPHQFACKIDGCECGVSLRDPIKRPWLLWEQVQAFHIIKPSSCLAMAMAATLLGLSATSPDVHPPSHAATYLIFHFIFSHVVVSTRFVKRLYGLDHNAAPRQDLEKYGEAAVSSGKISQHFLDQMKRMEAAHLNSMEQFPLFAVSMIWAEVTGLDPETMNMLGLWYTGLRVLYVLAYVLVESEGLARIRGFSWWASNYVCFRVLWLGGKLANAKRVAVL
jgi:uncharacterized MAPEG superfamily protein